MRIRCARDGRDHSFRLRLRLRLRFRVSYRVCPEVGCLMVMVFMDAPGQIILNRDEIFGPPFYRTALSKNTWY